MKNIDFENCKFSVKSYRSPELILSEDHYDHKIDVWSAGVIMAELFMRNNLFESTDDENEERILYQILQISDIPLEDAKLYYKDIEKNDLSDIIPTSNQDALDLIKKCLRFQKENRISSKKALEHPYFKEIHKIIQFKKKNLK